MGAAGSAGAATSKSDPPAAGAAGAAGSATTGSATAVAAGAAAAAAGAAAGAAGAGARVADSPFTEASSIWATSSTSISSRAVPSALAEVSPSESITRQNGQPTAIWSAPVRTASAVRFSLIRLPIVSSIHIRAPPAPQQKERSEWRSISTYSAPGRTWSSSRGGEYTWLCRPR